MIKIVKINITSSCKGANRIMMSFYMGSRAMLSANANDMDLLMFAFGDKMKMFNQTAFFNWEAYCDESRHKH